MGNFNDLLDLYGKFSCDNSKTPDVLADEKIIILGMAARHTTYILWHTLSDRIDSKTKISWNKIAKFYDQNPKKLIYDLAM